MITDQQLSTYVREGFVVLEDAISQDRLAEVQESYEQAITEALRLGRAERDDATGFLKRHRFQNPHHPLLARRPLMEALSAPSLMNFCNKLCEGNLAMYGIAAFAMNEDYDYRGPWHRDSYSAWDKDSPQEKRVREVKIMPATQILLALEDDESFWFVPGSHNRANTEEEEARFEEKRTGWEEMFPDMVQVKLRAGSAVPFDSRGIHRGLKPIGKTRRSLFIVFGVAEEVRHSTITHWALEPEYRDESYLASLPKLLREAIEKTQEALKG